MTTQKPMQLTRRSSAERAAYHQGVDAGLRMAVTLVRRDGSAGSLVQVLDKLRRDLKLISQQENP